MSSAGVAVDAIQSSVIASKNEFVSARRLAAVSDRRSRFDQEK
jgi:hypothetical protein